MADDELGERIRPIAEQSFENHVEIHFPDRSETLIMSDDIARELAEEMIEIVEEIDEQR